MNTHTLHTSPSQTNFAKWVMAATMTTMHDDDDNEHRKWRRGEREGCCSSVNDEHDENDNSGDDDMLFPLRTHTVDSHIFVECNRLCADCASGLTSASSLRLNPDFVECPRRPCRFYS